MHNSIYQKSDHYTGTQITTKRVNTSNIDIIKVRPTTDSYSFKHYNEINAITDGISLVSRGNHQRDARRAKRG